MLRGSTALVMCLRTRMLHIAFLSLLFVKGANMVLTILVETVRAGVPVLARCLKWKKAKGGRLREKNWRKK